MPVPLNSQQVEAADDITGSREQRSWSRSLWEPGLPGAADMEGHSSSGSRRPGTLVGLGPLPMPHGAFQTGAPSKVRPLKPSFSIPAPWSHTPHTHTAGTPVPLAEGWHSPLSTEQGWVNRAPWGLRGRDGTSGEKWS